MLPIMKESIFFLGQFLSESNLNELMLAFGDSIRDLSAQLKDPATSAPSPSRVLSMVCDLLSLLQGCNGLCWRAERAAEVLAALFALDCAVQAAGNRGERSWDVVIVSRDVEESITVV